MLKMSEQAFRLLASTASAKFTLKCKSSNEYDKRKKYEKLFPTQITVCSDPFFLCVHQTGMKICFGLNQTNTRKWLTDEKRKTNGKDSSSNNQSNIQFIWMVHSLRTHYNIEYFHSNIIQYLILYIYKYVDIRIFNSIEIFTGFAVCT